MILQTLFQAAQKMQKESNWFVLKWSVTSKGEKHTQGNPSKKECVLNVSRLVL